MKPIFRLTAAALLLGGTALAAPPAGPLVVELFTSQGCSSCPPADTLLGELAHRSDVLALALHVTYWNDLGWQDKFSQSQFDERQRHYVEKLRLGSSYTPQMVVNGAKDVVGSQRDAVIRVLAAAQPPAAITLRAAGDLLEVALPALEVPCDCELTLFGVQPTVRTPVGRGENSGKTLQEFQVVRTMRSLGKWRGEALALKVKRGRMPDEVSAYAVLAQERWTGRVVAAGR